MYSSHCLYKDSSITLKKRQKNTIRIQSKLQPITLNLFGINTIKTIKQRTMHPYEGFFLFRYSALS